MVFTLEVKYDDLGRIHQWRRKVGTSDLKAYEYVYDIGMFNLKENRITACLMNLFSGGGWRALELWSNY